MWSRVEQIVFKHRDRLNNSYESQGFFFSWTSVSQETFISNSFHMALSSAPLRPKNSSVHLCARSSLSGDLNTWDYMSEGDVCTRGSVWPAPWDKPGIPTLQEGDPLWWEVPRGGGDPTVWWPLMEVGGLQDVLICDRDLNLLKAFESYFKNKYGDRRKAARSLQILVMLFLKPSDGYVSVLFRAHFLHSFVCAP